MMTDLTDVAILPGVLIREQRSRRLALWTQGGGSCGMRLGFGAGHANLQRRGATASTHGPDSTLNSHWSGVHFSTGDRSVASTVNLTVTKRLN